MQRTLYPQISPPDDPDYPSQDGKPMSDNMRQYRWIVALQGGLDALFIDDPDVVVAGNCLWYPVEGNNKIRTAPDAMVIFGRPRGDRGSYIEHREAGVAPSVVFEVLSPGNRAGEMRRKLTFYEQYRVSEYYILDPDDFQHKGYLRSADKLVAIPELFGWTSPRLGIRFELAEAFRILDPDGRPFEFYTDVVKQRNASERLVEEGQLQLSEEKERTTEQRLETIREKRRADREKRRADEAQRQRDEQTQRAEQEKLRAERLLEQLRALGIEPEA